MQIDYIFTNQKLLKLALTHPSVLAARETLHHSGRLEFLGDSVLGMIIAELLYKHFPDVDEGVLSIMQANLVSTKTLAEVARDIKLGDDLILDKGEISNGGRENPRNLENAMEALIAAIYLDSNFATIYRIVSLLWSKYFQNKENLIQKNIKSKLQEEALEMGKTLPVYEIIAKTGPEHAPDFKVLVTIAGIGSATGEGKSKKSAEIAAASRLISMIEQKDVNE